MPANWPTDPMRQNDRFVAAFCDDLFKMCTTGTDPKSRDRIAEINRQVSISRETGAPNKPPVAIR